MGEGMTPVVTASNPGVKAASTYVYEGQHVPYEPLKMMRAIHVENFGGPEVLQLKTNLIVPPLTKTQVLVRVKCAGVNPVETYIREGQYSRYDDIFKHVNFFPSTALIKGCRICPIFLEVTPLAS